MKEKNIKRIELLQRMNISKWKNWNELDSENNVPNVEVECDYDADDFLSLFLYISFECKMRCESFFSSFATFLLEPRDSFFFLLNIANESFYKV